MSLYERTSSELEKSINLFRDIDKTLVRKKRIVLISQKHSVTVE
jgi:hypothetical protein